jgi:hypothetical protein
LDGFLEPRFFLNPETLPGYRYWRPHTLVFVHGRLRPGERPDSLFRMLVNHCKVTPFLFVTDGIAVLLGLVAPAPESSDGPRHVTAVLERSLREIQVIRESVASLRTIKNHCYDGLFVHE